MRQMPESVQTPGLDTDELREWIQQQRWYASKSRSVTGIEIAEYLPLLERPSLTLMLVQTRFATGTHELYQLLFGERTFDVFEAPGPLIELVRRMDASSEIEATEGRVAFHRSGALPVLEGEAAVRAVGVE